MSFFSNSIIFTKKILYMPKKYFFQKMLKLSIFFNFYVKIFKTKMQNNAQIFLPKNVNFFNFCKMPVRNSIF